MLWVHTVCATTFNICSVSVDRFIAIRFPFRYQDIVTKKRCNTVISLVWLLSLGLSFSTLAVDDEENIDFAVLFISSAFITSIIHLLLVSCSYICIFISAIRQFYEILARGNPESYNDSCGVHTIQNFKAIKTIGFVLSACMITWMPSSVLLFIDFYRVWESNWARTRKSFFVVWPWVDTIGFTSSAIDPFIYYFRNQEFRLVFLRIFRWLPCRLAEKSS